jgi:hypothetical protein
MNRYFLTLFDPEFRDLFQGKFAAPNRLVTDFETERAAVYGNDFRSFHNGLRLSHFPPKRSFL